jgi:hypothetical protein
MMLMEIGQAMWGDAARAVDAIALAPTPTPAPKEINTDGILNFFATKIVPILLARRSRSSVWHSSPAPLRCSSSADR